MAEKKIPKVRLGDTWVPAHRIWKVVESITTAADLVEKFNADRAELTTPVTRDVVDMVRTRIRDMELAMGGEGALQAAAIEAGVTEAGAQGAGQHGDTEVAGVAGKHGSIEVAAPGGGERLVPDEDFAEAARQLLAAMSVEEAVDMLKADYDNPVDIRSLVGIVGKEAYMDALAREARDFAANMIAPDQIAELWNDSELPSPIGGRWTTSAVEQLLR